MRAPPQLVDAHAQGALAELARDLGALEPAQASRLQDLVARSTPSAPRNAPGPGRVFTGGCVRVSEAGLPTYDYYRLGPLVPADDFPALVLTP